MGIHDQIIWSLKGMPFPVIVERFHLAPRIDPLDVAWPFAPVIGHIEIAVRTKRRAIGCAARVGKRLLATIWRDRCNATTFDFGDVDRPVRRPHGSFGKLETVS